jgi:hypothetical protein
MAEAYALVSLVQQGWADQREVARCDPQNLCLDSPYASYPLDLTATLQRLMRRSAGKVIHCPIRGPFPRHTI